MSKVEHIQTESSAPQGATKTGAAQRGAALAGDTDARGNTGDIASNIRAIFLRYPSMGLQL